MSLETSLALLLVVAWISLIGGSAARYLLIRYKFIPE